jgi:hypothetical protein
VGKAVEIASRVRATASAFDALRPEIEAGEPWPLAADFGPGPEALWGPREVLAHVAEMLPYWLTEAERVISATTSPAPFGRLQTDTTRLRAIEHDRRLPIGELLGRIERAAARYEESLAGWDDTALERRGLHPRHGEVSVAEILERFAAAHTEDHVRQLRDAMAPHA